jgi:hypothetical protein
MESTETISIRITEENVEWESDLSVPEIIFWLEVTKAMALKQILQPPESE